MPKLKPETQSARRENIIDAAERCFARSGFHRTTMQDICKVAGVSPGALYVYFKSKEDLALAAVDYWNTMTGGLFATAPYQQVPDPRDRALAYIDFRAEILQGNLPDFTCLLGTMVQETFETHPRVRDACNAGISSHAQTVAEILAAAKARYAADADWDPQTVALYTQAVIQGAFILAKAQGSAAIAAQCIAQLRTYVATLLDAPDGLCAPRPPLRVVKR